MDLDFNKNEDNMKQALAQLRNRYQKIAAGGGAKSIEKQHEKNKLTARERINYLIDTDSTFYEIGAFAGYDMYEEYGGCPAAGTLAGIGYVSVASVSFSRTIETVKAGAWFPITGKNLHAGDSNGKSPSHIYIVDSAGVFLPLQAEIFPDKKLPEEFLGTMHE
jgi:acetyl-CoA carboxylase carboxyltransferase component